MTYITRWWSLSFVCQLTGCVGSFHWCWRLVWMFWLNYFYFWKSWCYIFLWLYKLIYFIFPLSSFVVWSIYSYWRYGGLSWCNDLIRGCWLMLGSYTDYSVPWVVEVSFFALVAFIIFHWRLFLFFIVDLHFLVLSSLDRVFGRTNGPFFLIYLLLGDENLVWVLWLSSVVGVWSSMLMSLGYSVVVSCVWSGTSWSSCFLLAFTIVFFIMPSWVDRLFKVDSLLISGSRVSGWIIGD